MTGGPIKLDVDFKGLEDVLRNSPRAMFKHMREYLFTSFLSHRTSWLRVKGNKFGRSGTKKDGTKGRGIKVFKVAEKAPITKRSVHYVMTNKRRTATQREAITELAKLGGEIRTGSIVLKVLEFGGVTKSSGGKLMPIPVKTRPGNLAVWRRKYPNKKLRILNRRSGQGKLVFEETGKRKKKWRLRFVLTPKVTNKPTLKFYKTWNQLAAVRKLQWRKATDAMMSDMERGKP